LGKRGAARQHLHGPLFDNGVAGGPTLPLTAPSDSFRRGCGKRDRRRGGIPMVLDGGPAQGDQFFRRQFSRPVVAHARFCVRFIQSGLSGGLGRTGHRFLDGPRHSGSPAHRDHKNRSQPRSRIFQRRWRSSSFRQAAASSDDPRYFLEKRQCRPCETRDYGRRRWGFARTVWVEYEK